MTLFRTALRWPVLAIGLFVGSEAAASGHFDVDDAGTLDAGRCLTELWAGRLRSPADLNFQHMGGACAVGPVELGFNIDRTASPDSGASVFAGPQIKWNFWGREPDAHWSAAAALAASIDLRHGGRPGGQFLLPVTWRATDGVNILLNAGADWSTGSGASFARRGAAVEWVVTDHLTLIAERNRAYDLWTSRLGARITVATLTTVEVSASRSGGPGEGRWRGIVIGLNREFSRH